MLKFPKAYYETRKVKAEVGIETGFPEGEQLVVDETPLPIPSDKPTDLEKEPEHVAKIDTSWLPFAAKTYHISPRLEDYLVVNIPLCPSDLPNRNGVAFPIEELVKYQPPPISRQVYKAWSGCPMHLEHDNEDCTKAIGVIFDTSLRQIKGYGDGKHWAVMGLVGIDKTKHPEIAQKFMNGEMNTGSMGCTADSFTCSVCDSPASDNQFTNCAHISSTQHVNWKVVDHMGEKKIAYLNAHGLSPIEFSAVGDPAWCTCLSEVLLSK